METEPAPTLPNTDIPVHTAKAPHTAPPLPASSGWKVMTAGVVMVVGLAVVFVYGRVVRHREATALKQSADETADLPTPVEVVVVKRAEGRKLLSLPGEARAFNETTLYARTSGYINKWVADIGDHVKQGQTLAIIETPELDDQLVAARAKVDQAASNAKLAEAAAEFARITYERWQAAAPDGVVSEQERDQRKAEWDTSLARVAAAKAQIEVDQAEVRRLQTLSSFKNVTAPFDGTITQRHIDIGDLVTAGSTASTSSLYRIASVDQLRVFVDVPQSASPEIADGLKASIYATEYGDREFTGTVDRTAGAVDRVSRTMRVELVVPNPDAAIKPGDYVQVIFRTDRRQPPLEIPAAALAYRGGNTVVAVVDNGGKVSFRPVKVAQDMGDHIEIASGVTEGERVAINVSSEVVEGQTLDAHDKTQATALSPALPPVLPPTHTLTEAAH